MNDSPDGLFAGWSPTEPPSQVKERVLAAARRADVPARRRLEDRLWGSRPARIAWLAAAAALVAFNLWLPTPADNNPPGSTVASSPVDFDPVLASMIARHPPTRTTWADQRQLMPELLEETRSAAADTATDGGRS